MKTNSISDSDVKLTYFRTYHDFSYSIGGDFSVKVSGDGKKFTDFYLEKRGIVKKAVTINQPALSVFRYLSPDVFIGMISGYLISLYNSNSFEKFADIGELLEKSVNN